MTSTPPGQPPAARPAPPVPGPPPAEQEVMPVAQLAELSTLADRPLAEHVTVFEGVHRALSDQLRGAES